MKQNLSISALSLKNLRAKPVRTACLVVVVAILSFTLFGGSILILNLRQGLNVMTQRFGADLMVVPKGAADTAQAVLLRGESGLFYFDASIVDDIAQVEGVVCASPQFFLTSMAAECCTDYVQIIAYDPDTDFVIQPWIAERKNELIEDGQVVVGSRIDIGPNGTIKLFNHEYPVAAQLSRSASGFDTSIFMTMHTINTLMDTARTQRYSFIADHYGDEVISAVLIKADPTKSSSTLSRNIRRQNEDVDIIIAQSIFGSIAASIGGLVNYIHIFSVVIWTLAVIVLAAVFSGTAHERKKEFAILRILGATRKKLVSLVLSESSLAATVGSIAGIILASLVVFPFSTLISSKLELPYLDAPLFNIALLIVASLFLSVIVGPLSSLYAALRISKAETYFTLREGE